MKNRDLDLLKESNVLYIEDEEALLKQTSAVLEDFIGKIFPVRTTAEALEIIKNEQIDVIVSDILLENENGVEFLAYIKNELEYDIPAILTTAHSDTDNLLGAIKLHVDGYIIKPVNLKELLNALHDVLKPIIWQKEINKSYYTIKMISAVTDSKQVDIIRFIVKNLDDDQIFNYSYNDIMNEVDVSKPTVIKLFKQLAEKGILVKIQNGKYKFKEENLLMTKR